MKNDEPEIGPHAPNAQKYLRLLGKPTSFPVSEKQVLTSRGPGDSYAESAVTFDEPDMEEKLSLLMERLETAQEERPSAFQKYDVTAKAIVHSAQEAWRKLNESGAKAQLNNHEVIGLEAIVETDGSRPTLRFDENGELAAEAHSYIQPKWQHLLTDLKGTIENVATKVCRINLNGEHAGTGFSFGDHLILTNRHVLQDVATFTGGEWNFNGEVTADFGSGFHPSMQSFTCLETGIVCGRDEIDDFRLDFGKFDYAVLRCNPDPDKAFPSPIIPDNNSHLLGPSMFVCALGFPGPPQPGEFAGSLLGELFGHKYGIKRFSPGEIDFGLGHEHGDIHHSVFTYDSTTLPGSSGSVVLDISSMRTRAVGLHFAGWKNGNYAHALGAPAFRNDLQKGIAYPMPEA